MVSAVQTAKSRGLITLLKLLAAAYGTVCDITRDSSDKEVASAYRKLSRRVHPDKNGGNDADQKRLTAAYNTWQEALRQAPGHSGGKREAADPSAVLVPVPTAAARQEYRIKSQATLLTYQGFGGTSQFDRFLEFVQKSLKQWRVKYWSATLESNVEEGCHAHLMLQFTSTRDVTVKPFSFEGLRPNAWPAVNSA